MAEPEAAHITYAKALFSKTHSHALWEPDPASGNYASVELADVGYIKNGCFVKLFNASKDADGSSAYPDGHEPCVVGPINRRNPLPGGSPISSEGVSEVGMEGGLTSTAGLVELSLSIPAIYITLV